MSKKWELSIVVPQSDNATAIARMVMADKHPWCLLISTDLIHHISQNVGGEFDVSKFRESVAGYICIATRHGAYMQKIRALILNKQGRALKKLNKRDSVKQNTCSPLS